MGNGPLSKEWRKPWLVQRLEKPLPEPKTEQGKLLHALNNAFSFGGGLVNGGFSKEAMALLHNVCAFDYMGSSEFEWGAVPNAFARMYDDHDAYITGKMHVKCSKVNYSKKSRPVTYRESDIWYICRPEHEDNVKAFIKECADDKERLKEVSMLRNLVCDPTWGERKVGWIELNVGFMFFREEKMFKDMCELLSFKIK
mgnify:CR=1 FL=1